MKAVNMKIISIANNENKQTIMKIIIIILTETMTKMINN
jgi:hypothetical protein